MGVWTKMNTSLAQQQAARELSGVNAKHFKKQKARVSQTVYNVMGECTRLPKCLRNIASLEPAH